MGIEAVGMRISQIQSTINALSPQETVASAAQTTASTTGGSLARTAAARPGPPDGMAPENAGAFAAALGGVLAGGAGGPVPGVPDTAARASTRAEAPEAAGAVRRGAPGAAAEPTDGRTEPSSATSGPSATGTGFGDRIVQAAREHLGVRYVWGGNTPAQGFDCSGLVKYVLADLGVSMPRVARDQAKTGTRVDSLAEARPGDLLGMRNGAHIAIYLGDNKILHAPRPGENVSIRPLYSWDDIDTIRRVAPAGTESAGGGASATRDGSSQASTRAAFEQLAGAGT